MSPTKFKGVEGIRDGRWRAFHRRLDRETTIGYFETDIGAAEAVDEYLIAKRGILGALGMMKMNFPSRYEAERQKALTAFQDAEIARLDRDDRLRREARISPESYPEVLKRFLAGESVDSIAKSHQVETSVAAQVLRTLVGGHFASIGLDLEDIIMKRSA